MDAYIDFVTATIAIVLATLTALIGFVRRASSWGATSEEVEARMTGDRFLDGGSSIRVVMTRAVTIARPPEIVWPWLAQLGRGAGWYSYDVLDNGRKRSAEHIVSWIPKPALGDASPIGYLRYIDEGHELVWWAAGVSFFGAAVRLVTDMRIHATKGGTRLLIRMSADAAGATARPTLWLFQFMDAIMAVQQLRGIEARVEAHGARTSNPVAPETGASDQFQYYEVVYANGDAAGVSGQGGTGLSRLSAIEDGVIQERT